MKKILNWIRNLFFKQRLVPDGCIGLKFKGKMYYVKMVKNHRLFLFNGNDQTIVELEVKTQKIPNNCIAITCLNINNAIRKASNYLKNCGYESEQINIKAKTFL